MGHLLQISYRRHCIRQKNFRISQPTRSIRRAHQTRNPCTVTMSFASHIFHTRMARGRRPYIRGHLDVSKGPKKKHLRTSELYSCSSIGIGEAFKPKVCQDLTKALLSGCRPPDSVTGLWNLFSSQQVSFRGDKRRIRRIMLACCDSFSSYRDRSSHVHIQSLYRSAMTITNCRLLQDSSIVLSVA